MFTVIVTEKGGDQKRLDFDKPEITIGRVQGNDIILPKGNVSKRHSRIVLKDGKFIIVDLKSTNGTYVNGRKITSPLVIKDTDKIYIGDFIITLEEAGASAGAGLGGSAPPLPGPPGLGAPPSPPRKPLPPARALDAAPVGDADDDRDDDDDLPSPPAPDPVVAPPPPARPVAPPPPRGTGGQASLGAAPLPPPSPRVSGGTMPPPLRDPLAARPPSTGGPANGPLAPATAARPSISEPPPAPLRDAVTAGPTTAPPVPGSRRTAGMGAAVPPPPTPSVVPGSAPPARLVGAGAPAMESIPAAPPPPAATPAPAPAPVSPIAPTMVPPPAVLSPPIAAPAVVPIVAQPAPSVAPPDPRRDKALELQREVSGKLVAQLDLERVPVERLADEALWQRAERVIVELVEQMDGAGQIPSFVDHDALIKDTLNETLGLGPLEDLLADDTVGSIVVNRHDRLLIDRTTTGRLEHSDKVFSSEHALRQVISRLTVPLGLHTDSPLVDVRLPDGARLTAVLPPAAPRGPTLVLRKPRQGAITLDDLVRASVLSKPMADFLAVCVTARKNVLVCGGAGAQKAMLLSALAGATGAGERIVSVEEVGELNIGRDGWIPLEARTDLKPAQLLASARALRPDRLVVGEVGGSEAFELLASIASAQDGTLLATAGEGARPALHTLETLARLGAGNASSKALRELIAAGVHVVVHLARYADGVQRVASVSEVVGVKGEDLEVRELFHFHTQGRGPDGVIRGKFAGLGVIPHFFEALEARGITADASVFKS